VKNNVQKYEELGHPIQSEDLKEKVVKIGEETEKVIENL